MIAASRSPAASARARQVAPIDVAVVLAATTFTLMPAITADAALVPWADEGMRHTVRCASPLARGAP